MPTNHDAVAALPVSGSANKQLLRNAITARMPYVLADNENATDLIAVDPASGSAVVDITFLGRLFHYDPTDVVTAHDGVTCLVTSEGRRYKLSDGSDVFCYSVLDRTRTAPPASPSLGDAHLVAAAATGAWVGKDGYIATRTARGWEFILFGVGRFVYVEDVDTYYHRNSGGAWVSGFGNRTTAPNSIPLSAAINFGKRLIVENQTTTAPPGTATVGTAYIVGPSATGAWAGRDGDIAVCEVANTFTLYDPTNGWSAYDKAQNNEYRFNGTTWVSASGALLSFLYVSTVSGSITSVGSGGAYSYTATGAPANEPAHRDTGCAISHQARKSGALLRLTYSFAPNGQYRAVAIYRDSELSAIAWCSGPDAGNYPAPSMSFVIVTGDALPHTYTAALMDMPSGGISAMTRRTLTIEEFA